MHSRLTSNTMKDATSSICAKVRILLSIIINLTLGSFICQANEAGSSSSMEFLGHQKALAFLLGTGMVIKSFISDRHQSIAKWMREECPKKCRELGKPLIDHFFDLWHIGKSNYNKYCVLLIMIN